MARGKMVSARQLSLRDDVIHMNEAIRWDDVLLISHVSRSGSGNTDGSCILQNTWKAVRQV